VLLPVERFRGAIIGGPVTGTEREFEDALANVRETGGILLRHGFRHPEPAPIGSGAAALVKVGQRPFQKGSECGARRSPAAGTIGRAA